MLKKVIRLNLDDLFLCLGVVTGLFVLIQGVIAAVLLLSAENSGIMISGTVLPIVAGIMALVVTVAAMGVSFEQAIRFGQTRRRALGMELGRSLFMGVCSMGMAALLTALEQGDYNKYLNALAQHNNDRNFAYGVYRDQWDRNYQLDRDGVNDSRYDMEWNYGVGRDELEDSRYQDETEYARALEKAQTLAAGGDFSGYKAMGYSDQEIANLKNAYDREQASVLFKLMTAMIYMDEELCERLNVIESRKKLIDPVSGSEFTALSSETKGKHGKSSSFIVFDELAQFGADRELYDVMMTSRGAHAEPLVWCISTQAVNDAAVLSELVDYGLKVNRGEIDDPKFKVFLFSVPMDADPWEESNWPMANPALGDFRSLEEMRDTAEKAKRMPAAEAAFRNLYLNQRVDGAAHFITPDVWARSGGEPDASLFEERPVYGGLDLSGKNDLTALVLTTQDGEGRRHVLPLFWTPEEGIRDRADRDRVPYDAWAREGFLLTTPGRTIDYRFVAHEIVKLHAVMDIAGLKFDRWRIDDMVRALREEGVEAWIEGRDAPVAGGLRLIPHGQGFRDMNPAVETLEDVLAEGAMRHGMHPVLTMCASNVRVQRDPSGNRKFDKIKSTGRIDGIVALAMALNGAVCGVPEEEDTFFAEAW